MMLAIWIICITTRSGVVTLNRLMIGLIQLSDWAGDLDDISMDESG